VVILEKIWYRNFLNIVEEEFPLRDQGLVLVVGENGAGKSALTLEGIFYALYGKTFRWGAKPGISVWNRHASKRDERYLRLKLTIDGETYQIIRCNRSQNYPKGLTLLHGDSDKIEECEDITGGTSDATQSMIEDRLGMGSKTANYSFLFSPEIARFPTLGDTEKKKIFDEILQLDKLSYGQEATKSALKEAKQLLDNVERRVVHLKEMISDHEHDLKTTRRKAKNWEVELAEEVSGIKDQLDSSKEDYKRYQKTLKDAQNVQTDSEKLADESSNEYHRIKGVIDEFLNEAREERGEVLQKIRSKEGLISELKGQLSKSQEWVDEGKCPSCGSELSRDFCTDFEDKKARYEKLKSQVVKLKAVKDKMLEESNSEVEAANEKLENQRILAERHKKERSTSKEAERVASNVANSELSRIHTFEARLEAAKTSCNPHGETVIALKAKIDGYLKELGEKESKIPELEANLASEEVLSHVFGPKGARLVMIENSLPLLNDEASKIQEEMDTQLSVTFELRGEDESYSGTLMSVVDNPTGAADYKGDSSGEKRRVDLIMVLSLMGLARSRGNKSIGQAFFDEAFENLDDKGQASVINILRKICKDCNTIFILSHAADELGGQCDQIWTVKDGKLDYGKKVNSPEMAA
jgi:DNA repair exonuclease SbcCD ATPase subunit